MSTINEMRAEAIADQTNAAAVESVGELYAAIRTGDWDLIEEAIKQFGMTAMAAGWDQAAADHRAIFTAAGLAWPE